jgi:3-phenylpropionate/trans-cinnamate dioxygenase ferredoxin reductase component
MQAQDVLLIVGASHAGVELAMAARQQGWPGPIVLLGDEVSMPYQRPPLSKAWLSGEADADAMLLRPPSAFESAQVTLRLGTRVRSIDREARSIRLENGEELHYARLALCTGGRPRLLDVPGLPADVRPSNLLYLRTQSDAQQIRAHLVPGARVVVIGGGYVGLEVAASARKLDATVTVIEAQARVLQRVTGHQISAFYEDVHRAAGVDVRTGAGVRRIDCADDGKVCAVECTDGTRIETDVVVAGVGMLPNSELAAAAGLELDPGGGIMVDALSQTSDEFIFAAGDCTAHHSALYGRPVRLESVPNALEQARAAASTICGNPKPNHTVPWFWSDQYDLKLQMVGLSQGHESVVLRGDVATRSFIALYLLDGRVIAADAVNRPADFMQAKRAVAAGLRLDADALADEKNTLKELCAIAAAGVTSP